MPSSCTALDPGICRAARLARDARFDGQFFVGVLSTGIYCRPICPAIAPKEVNVRYFDSALRAAQAGLRPCLRCRPDSAPDSCAWKGTNTTLERAIGLIDAGILMGEDKLSVTALAEKLGISSRYLGKLFTQGFGTSPKQYALYRQLMFAKQLLHQTQLSVTQVALAAGFNSIRRFNEAFKQELQLTPTALRRSGKASRDGEAQEGRATGLCLYQYYRPPLDWSRQWAFYRLRAVAGMEWLDDEQRYGRSFRLGKLEGFFELLHEPEAHRFRVNIQLAEGSDLSGLRALVSHIRRLLDLDADMMQVQTSLTPLHELGVPPLPGLRLPGVGCAFEAGCRAVLGQQVSVVQASKLLNLLVRHYGESREVAGRRLTFFPSPQAISHASLDELKMPGARKAALNQLAQFICDNPGAPPDAWLEVKGIGPWTVAYAKMRGLGDPNVFLGTDLVVKNRLLALAPGIGKQDYPGFAGKLASAIAPWGSYLTFQLWNL
ncbi:DNA-3-methyladenine glycosylase 2 family protein [Shewanella salipaludis]|uniref:Helix-turn-helix domain-containing protein n=1 Tax=Shewanella salipaludis TaxID=2723052 RepID=A0A972JM04_9GAMM|nr:AlkA N-terminal domain-containing protein [Shewanella salipaludis]NMH66007.1 helix-turn-helix domain-containing protein [Shewanella salipaludis]